MKWKKYKKVLRMTGVFALIPETMTGKFKFAQKTSEEDRRRQAEKRRERRSPSDLLIASEMIKIPGPGSSGL